MSSGSTSIPASAHLVLFELMTVEIYEREISSSMCGSHLIGKLTEFAM